MQIGGNLLGNAGLQDEAAEDDAPAVIIAAPPERPIERGIAGPRQADEELSRKMCSQSEIGRQRPAAVQSVSRPRERCFGVVGCPPARMVES